MEVSILDTSGSFFGALAGEESSELLQDQALDLVRAVRNARCLVLCIDAASKPQVELAGFISRLLGVGSRRLKRMGAKPWPAGESPWERAPRLELPFERVLVMLTHIETLCIELARQVARVQREWLTAQPAEIKSLADCRRLSAWDIAELLDFAALAAERIDSLDLLASSLKPDAHLALCGVSSVGLERTPPGGEGEALEALDFERSGAREGLSFELGEPEPLVGPAPFGIWQSLLFMTTGRVLAPAMTIARNRRSAASPR